MRKKKSGKLKTSLDVTPTDVKMNPVDFPEIRRRRLKKKLTIEGAAAAAGWKVQRWGDVERGRRKDPQVSTLVAVAKVLTCKVDDLLRKE